MQKVYVTEEEKEKFMEKLNRDVEVGERFCCCCCCFSPLPHSGSISPLRLLLCCCLGNIKCIYLNY